MEFSNPSDNLGATSAPEAATPAAVASTPTTEALQPNQAQPDSTTGSQPPIGESPTPSQEIEFPDDATFQGLPPEQRRSNWQQLRDQYAETKRRLGELSQYESFKPTVEQLEQRGGYDRLSQQAEWADSLFSPLIDPETNEYVYDPDGMLQYTAEPFIERLLDESPSTFGEVMWRGFDMPSPYNPDETIGHWFLRERLGLNPELLATYQQIQSPKDGARFMHPASISPDELSAIPDRYHELYRALTPELRDEVGLMGDVAREQFLANQHELYENRKFREEQKAWQQEQQQRERQAFQSYVQQESERLRQSVRDATVNAAKEKLKSEAVFSQDQAVNGAIWDEIISWSANQVMADPILAKDNATCERLYDLSVQYDVQGDRFKAQEARIKADQLATKLSGRFNNFITARTAFWSKPLGAARSATQQQIQNLQPRAEIGTGSPAANKRPISSALNVNGFGFTPEQYQQWDSQISQSGMNR